MEDKDNRRYWILSVASLLSPFVFFTAVLLFQRVRYPGYSRLGPGQGDAGIGRLILMEILLAVGLGCSVGLSVNIFKMKRIGKKGMLDYIAFLLNGVPLAAIMYALVRLQAG